jgi:hypothetical protein
MVDTSHGLDLCPSRKGILRYGRGIAILTRQGLVAIESRSGLHCKSRKPTTPGSKGDVHAYPMTTVNNPEREIADRRAKVTSRATRALPFTQAQVRRAVKGVQSAGLRVRRVTVNYDGSITLDSVDDDKQSVDNPETAHATSWDDV